LFQIVNVGYKRIKAVDETASSEVQEGGNN